MIYFVLIVLCVLIGNSSSSESDSSDSETEAKSDAHDTESEEEEQLKFEGEMFRYNEDSTGVLYHYFFFNSIAAFGLFIFFIFLIKHVCLKQHQISTLYLFFLNV